MKSTETHAPRASHLPGRAGTWRACALPLILIAGTLTLQACTEARADLPDARLVGAATHLGRATAFSYANMDETGAPEAIGVVFPSSFFDQLPAEPSDLHQCADRDGDGEVERPAECAAWHEGVLPLPSEISTRDDIPFKWALLNWNPMGHMPPGVYDIPHFDVHFYIQPIEDVFAIEPGPCGADFVQCEQFQLGVQPVPDRYVAPDYQNADAVSPAMGNHLIDMTSPELAGEPFTRTWIYGTYAGRITFYEEMLTKAYLLTRPNACFPIKQAAAVETAGYYPTQSCIRYDATADEYTVSMEGFEYRDAG